MRGKLSKNEKLVETIPESYSQTNVCRTDLSLTLLSLFVPWNHLSSLFLAERAVLETYEEFYWRVWVKCEPKLSFHIPFYTKNVCQMQKTRIEIRANIDTCTDARKAAQLTIDDLRNEITDMVDSNKKAEIVSTNVKLAKFGVSTKMSLVDSPRKTCCK